MLARESEVRGFCGIASNHLSIFRRVAEQFDSFIMVRQVNHWSTDLIGAGYPTKGLTIKGKSADWGPQAGFICLDQGFSKLAQSADAGAIGKANEKTKSCISHGDAVRVPLVISESRLEQLLRANAMRLSQQKYVSSASSSHWFRLEKIASDAADRHAALQLLPASQRQAQVYRVLSGRVGSEASQPLEVLADPISRLPLTADYDLFGTAAPAFRCASSGMLLVDSEQHAMRSTASEGVRSQLELSMIEQINAGCGTRVCHHGTELRNPHPEESWFPITVFSPVRILGLRDARELQLVASELLAMDYLFHYHPKLDLTIRGSIIRQNAKRAPGDQIALPGGISRIFSPTAAAAIELLQPEAEYIERIRAATTAQKLGAMRARRG